MSFFTGSIIIVMLAALVTLVTLRRRATRALEALRVHHWSELEQGDQVFITAKPLNVPVRAIEPVGSIGQHSAVVVASSRFGKNEITAMFLDGVHFAIGRVGASPVGPESLYLQGPVRSPATSQFMMLVSKSWGIPEGMTIYRARDAA